MLKFICVERMEDSIELPSTNFFVITNNILSFLEDEFLSNLFQNPKENPLYKKCIVIFQAVKEKMHDQMGPNIALTAYDIAFFGILYNLIKQIIQEIIMEILIQLYSFSIMLLVK